MRADTYASIKAYSETDHAKTLEGEDKRFLDRVLRDYERKGLHLPEETRAVIAGMWTTPCSSVCVSLCFCVLIRVRCEARPVMADVKCSIVRCEQLRLRYSHTRTV